MEIRPIARRPEATWRDSGGARHPAFDRLLGRVVDGALAGCIFLVPLLMGGRQALGQLVLVVLAVTGAAAWMLRQGLRRDGCWRYSSAEWLLLAGVGLLIVQLAPLPEWFLGRLSPRLASLLPLWTTCGDANARLGTWPCISLTPAATQAALVLLIAYGLLFLVTVQRIRSIEDMERLLRWMALSAALMAGFALLQLLASNGKFFWFYEHPFSSTDDAAKGSFTNRNHFAHFLALGFGPLVWWLQHDSRSRRSARQGLLGGRSRGSTLGGSLSGGRILVLGVTLFAGLLSLSRGGILMILVAAALSLAVCFRANTLRMQFVLSVIGIGLLMGVLLSVHGYDEVSDRVDELSSGSLETIDHGNARRTVWSAVLKAIPDFALLGTGAGSHSEVYRMYLENPPDLVYTHAENGFLQVAEETGAIGLTFVMAGIVLCARWCVSALREAPSDRLLVCAGAVSAGLLVNVLHSLADFVWYVPGCMAVVAILAAGACRLRQLADHARPPSARPMLLHPLMASGTAAVVAAVGMGMVWGRIGPVLAEPSWDQYRILKRTLPRVSASEDEEPGAADAGLDLDDPSLDAVARMIAQLEQVVAADDTNAEAFLELAAAYVRHFDLLQQASENAMPLAQIRSAVQAARARSSPDEVGDWLSRLLGERRAQLERALQCTRRALTLCPLQGEGYFNLAWLRFLEGVDGEALMPAYVDQALRVRPFDGAVLLEAGRAAIGRAECLRLEAGHDAEKAALAARTLEQGLNYWILSFRCGCRYQKPLIEALVGRIPVSDFLEVFQPDLQGLRQLHASYVALGKPEQNDRLQRLFADFCQVQGRTPEDAGAARAWYDAQLREVRVCYVQRAQSDAESYAGSDVARRWLEIRWIYRQMGDLANALRCARRAYQCDPSDFAVRYGLGESLADEGQYSAAEEHLHFCLQRKPNEPRLRRKIEEIIRARLGGEEEAAHGETASTGMLRR